jgi:hypothetical protein
MERVTFRKNKLIDEIFSCHSKTSIFDSSSSGSNMLVDSKVLKRFFSCVDGLDDIFKDASESILDNKSSLCQHRKGEKFWNT